LNHSRGSSSYAGVTRSNLAAAANDRRTISRSICRSRSTPSSSGRDGIPLLGVGIEHAAQLLVTAGGNPERLRSEASFAALCAASPIPASSGKTNRHRLNPAGDRDANRALYMITLVRLRYCPETKAYTQRRQADGLSKREAIRCVKRYVARQTYHAIRADLAA